MEKVAYFQGELTLTEDPCSPQPLRIVVTAEVPDEEGQEYTAVEMLLNLANRLKMRGAIPTMLRLEISPAQSAKGHPSARP